MNFHWFILMHSFDILNHFETLMARIPPFATRDLRFERARGIERVRGIFERDLKF